MLSLMVVLRRPSVQAVCFVSRGWPRGLPLGFVIGRLWLRANPIAVQVCRGFCSVLSTCHVVETLPPIGCNIRCMISGWPWTMGHSVLRMSVVWFCM